MSSAWSPSHPTTTRFSWADICVSRLGCGRGVPDRLRDCSKRYPADTCALAAAVADTGDVEQAALLAVESGEPALMVLVAERAAARGWSAEALRLVTRAMDGTRSDTIPTDHLHGALAAARAAAERGAKDLAWELVDWCAASPHRTELSPGLAHAVAAAGDWQQALFIAAEDDRALARVAEAAARAGALSVARGAIRQIRNGYERDDAITAVAREMAAAGRMDLIAEILPVAAPARWTVLEGAVAAASSLDQAEEWVHAEADERALGRVVDRLGEGCGGPG
jgi:hypothetical protein